MSEKLFREENLQPEIFGAGIWEGALCLKNCCAKKICNLKFLALEMGRARYV